MPIRTTSNTHITSMDTNAESNTTTTTPLDLEHESRLKHQLPRHDTTNITLDTNAELNTITQTPMDLEHESCLKQQLLRHAVQDEVDIFMDNPAYVHDSFYLDFIYSQVRDIPLLNCHEKAKLKLEELVLNLPKFLTVSQRASKHDQQNTKLRVFVAGTFHLNFRTPLERQEDRKILQQVRIRNL